MVSTYNNNNMTSFVFALIQLKLHFFIRINNYIFMCINHNITLLLYNRMKKTVHNLALMKT